MHRLGLVVGFALGVTTVVGAAQGESRTGVTPMRLAESAATARGSEYSEDFESFAEGALNGQGGWSGAANALVIETMASAFGDRTVRYVSDGSATFAAGASSPDFGVGHSALSFDITISALDSQHCVEAADLETGFLNTRLCFLSDGSIDALQVTGPDDEVGFFAETAGQWAATVITRLTIEVEPDGTLRVLQDGEVIFDGTDIASVISGETNGVSAFDTVHENSSGSIFLLDNLEGRIGPACPADLNGDNVIGSADLALLLALWGETDSPANLDGSGTVGSADLALLLALWGPCPE